MKNKFYITLLLTIIIIFSGCIGTQKDQNIYISDDDSWGIFLRSTEFIAFERDGRMSMLSINDQPVSIELTFGDYVERGLKDFSEDQIKLLIQLKEEEKNKVQAEIMEKKAILDKNPNDYDILYNLACLSIKNDEPLEAITYCNRILEMRNNDPRTLGVRRLGYFGTRQYDKALEDNRAFMDNSVQAVPGGYYLIGRIYFAKSAISATQNRYTDAFAEANAAIDAFKIVEVFFPKPTTDEIKDALAELYIRRDEAARFR